MFILAALLLSGCVNLSNRVLLKTHAPFLGIQKIAVFIQHWPVYLQKPGRPDLSGDFITPETIFFGPWEPAAQKPPRAIDVGDFTAAQVGEIIVTILEQKGYQVFLVAAPPAGNHDSVKTLMTNYQQHNPPVDAFLFCYFAPTLFVSHRRDVPEDHGRRSFSLQEIVAGLSPGADAVIWVGRRDRESPSSSVSHAFIYWAMSLMRPSAGRLIMAQADSRTGGQVRPWVPRCPPAATDKDYPAGPEIIKRLMLDNFACRLRHEIPFAFLEEGDP